MPACGRGQPYVPAQAGSENWWEAGPALVTQAGAPRWGPLRRAVTV